MSEFEIRKSNTLEVCYTGGDFQLSTDQSRLFTTCSGLVKVLGVDNGQEIYSIGESESTETVTCFKLYDDNSHIVICYNNGIIKQFRLHESSATMTCQFRSTHTAPILICILSADSTILFTGSADFTVKLWNISERSCLQTLKGPSVVSAIRLVDASTLIVGYVEGQLRIFDLSNRRLNPKDLNIHSSRISAILIDDYDNNTVYVASRDQTMSILDVKTQSSRRILPLYEPIESAVFSKKLKQIVTVGEEGILKFWDPIRGTEVKQKKLSSKGLDNIAYTKNGSLFVCGTVEQNLIFVDAISQSIIKQLAGFNEEIFDVSLVSHELNCIAVATNSPQLRLYDLTNFNCTLVEGHTDLILGVDSAQWDGGLLASCSKDNSCLLWRVTKTDLNESALTVEQVGIATGHTNSVSAVCFSKHRENSFFVTVSKDQTLKLWNLKQLLMKVDGESEQKFIKLTADSTLVAHEKDITSVEISENDKLCATGSMDKTAKLWHIDKNKMQLGIAGTLSGHKRGIWSIKFSNVSQIIATGSGDCTIKIFSLTDLSCQMTMEGHSFAVLNVNFINNATQLLSTDTSGLVKMWTVKTGVCEKTVECHEDKIWAFEIIEPSTAALDNLAKRKRKLAETETDISGLKLLPEERRRYVTAGSDSRIIVWEDITEEYAEEQARLAAERLAQIQTLENFIRLEKYEEALKLTLTLDHPYQCYKTLGTILAKGSQLGTLFKELEEPQLVKLLDFTAQWNTNTRTYAIGQSVLHSLLSTFTPKQLLALPNYADTVKALLPYTKRHFDRLVNMQQDVAFINYLTSRMEALEMKPKV